MSLQSCPTLCNTVARQAPLSTGFSRQEHWSGLPFSWWGSPKSPARGFHIFTRREKPKILTVNLSSHPSLLSQDQFCDVAGPGTKQGRLLLRAFVPDCCSQLTNVLCLLVQSCLILGDPMDYGPPGFSVHEILHGRILEWVAMPFSRGSSRPRDGTHIFRIAGEFFTSWATTEAQEYWSEYPIPSPGDLPNLGIEPRSRALQVDSLPAEQPGKPNPNSLDPDDSCPCLLMFLLKGHLLRGFPSSLGVQFQTFPLPMALSYLFFSRELNHCLI